MITTAEQLPPINPTIQNLSDWWYAQREGIMASNDPISGDEIGLAWAKVQTDYDHLAYYLNGTTTIISFKDSIRVMKRLTSIGEGHNDAENVAEWFRTLERLWK